jgi:hypothetical protein
MASFPAFSATGPRFNLGPGHLCVVCSQVPFNQLPFEDEEAYAHQPSLDALEKSSERCAMCALLYWAAGCSLINYGGMVAFFNIDLPSGAQLPARSMGSMYSRFGMRALENGACMIDLCDPVADYRPPIEVDLRSTFPDGIVIKDGESKPLRPWLFGNWYKSGFVGNNQLLMVGLGVRLGISGKIQDSVDYDRDTVNLRGSYLRFRTDQGTFLPASVFALPKLTTL